MGDSTCLMQMQQPFCYASGIINEPKESNPIHALGQSSVSFGRFMSESLAWEKWSSFSHNRYVEEAERFSRPGSVAQKKAFFEAHYKKLAAQKAAAAAALLEQANDAAAQNSNEDECVEEAANNDVEQNNAIDNDSERSSLSTRLVDKEEQDSMIRANGDYSVSNLEKSGTILPQSNKVEEAVSKMEEEPLIGNSMKVELQSQIEDAEKIHETNPIMTPLLKGSSYDQEVLPSVSKKKPPVSSFKLLKSNGTSKVASTPIKPTAASVSSKRDNNYIAATPTSSSSNNKHASLLSSADKRRSTPNKSLPMSVTFTPIRELNRLTASVMKKFESARAGAGSSKTSKDASLTPLRTPTMAYKKEKEKQMHSALTPLTEKRRNKTPLDLSSTGNNTASSKWRLLSTENKMRSPMISSPFSLRTEERAERRKKKLEEKFNANEAQKVQLHTKLKEKAETEIRKLRQSFCFKARPLPDFYKERKESNKETKKEPPQTHSESRKATPQTQRPYSKNFQEKTPRRTFAHHLSTALENTSPNIQQGSLRNRNKKQ